MVAVVGMHAGGGWVVVGWWVGWVDGGAHHRRLLVVDVPPAVVVLVRARELEHAQLARALIEVALVYLSTGGRATDGWH